MLQTVELPVWLLVLIVLFAAITVASHFLFPSVRWFFRKRAERVVARVNKRLARPIEPFKLARRFDTIQRLKYDPQVIEAVQDHARAEGIPQQVAAEQAERYAREIVPSFSATAYFGFGIRVARWLARSVYRIRVGDFDRARFEEVSPDATVVFVMNHRSNMDYVLVTYLVSQASTLSYAVGEWARIWPMSWIIRMMGAYFIRRRSRGLLYRRVLARYVQIATENGVSQALFPEGGLSLDGRIAPPKLGLLSYIASSVDTSRRDVVFVPVALNYDRVLEDRILIEAAASGERRFRAPLPQIGWNLMRHIWTRLRGRFDTFGEGVVSFGRPLALSEFAAGREGDLAEALATELMARIAATVPVVPVPLVATAVLQGARGHAILPAVEELIAAARAAGAPVPDRTAEDVVTEARARLLRRGLVESDGTPVSGQEVVLEFYAASIAHHLPSN